MRRRRKKVAPQARAIRSLQAQVAELVLRLKVRDQEIADLHMQILGLTVAAGLPLTDQHGGRRLEPDVVRTILEELNGTRGDR
jgi:hypothetical protein